MQFSDTFPLIAGQTLHGFRVLRAEPNPELRGRAVTMEHIRTGARLFWLDNGLENKVFCIGFCTLPEDDTGVFHILEHSVLCGSGKYPVREPFVELLKSSMSTFLNAMTFPDMTLYPVASRNDRDLMNLTSVYLDAVFDPACVREEKIFRQEGWHIEEDESGAPVFKGVVFNEMKGAMSDADSLIEQEIARRLFPDTAYGFNSGGEPEHIPSLTWEAFCAQYRRHYHPSNACIYLDGAVPLGEMLPLIDSYLSRYDRREDLPVFTLQTPVGADRTIRYELSAEEDEADKAHYTVSRLVGSWRDRAENMARGIIGDVLTGSNEAPLKRAALERNLCQDLSIITDDTGFQSWVTIHAERVTDGREPEIDALLREQGERILREGLDLEAAEASLNRVVYSLREEEEPQGIGRCIRCMSAWFYGCSPEEALESDCIVAEVRAMLRDGRLSRLAADLLLNRDHAVIVRALPSRTVGAEWRDQEAARLRRIVDSWTPEQAERNERMLDTLVSWQQTPDAEEALRTLPVLTREDAAVAPEWTETEECLTEGVPTLVHRLPCNGIVHLRAYFPLTECALEDLPRSAALAALLGKLPTANHDAWSLQQEIKRYTGALSFAVLTRSPADQSEVCTPFLAASVSALEEHVEKAEQLLAEVLLSTRFDEEEKIAEIIRQMEMVTRQRIVSSGHSVGIRTALSGFSAENAARNALEGEPMIRFIHDLARDPEGKIPALKDQMREILGRTVCRSRMTVSETCEKPVLLDVLIRDVPLGTPAPKTVAYPLKAAASAAVSSVGVSSDSSAAPASSGAVSAPRIGFRIPARIGFAVRAGRLSEYGARFSGTCWLAAGIISLGYLWNRVRVQGGAYGAGLSVDRMGNVFTYSFRDPTPAKTLTVDAGISAFLREFADSGEELDKYIISALNERNPLLSQRDKGAHADGRYLSGYTREDAERVRREILNTTREDLVACGAWLDAFARQGSVCVVAHDDALQACGDLQITDL